MSKPNESTLFILGDDDDDDDDDDDEVDVW